MDQRSKWADVADDVAHLMDGRPFRGEILPDGRVRVTMSVAISGPVTFSVHGMPPPVPAGAEVVVTTIALPRN